MAAFRKAALARPWNLPKAESPSGAVRDAMAVGAADLPEKVKLMMAMRAGDASKRAIASGRPEQLTHAMALCEASRAVGVEPAGPCDAVMANVQK